MTIIPYTFTPLPSFPPTLLPNTLFYNATSTLTNLTYQISLSYPFSWGSPSLPTTQISTNTPPLTIYITDGNALFFTAADHIKRRKPVDSTQPDILAVGIGYPLTDNVYALSQRNIDFGVPVSGPVQVNDFVQFINSTLRPWVREQVFPGVRFGRDAIYGHSSGGWFVAYGLSRAPELFDTWIAGSPSLTVRTGSVLEEVTKGLGNGMEIKGEIPEGGEKPAVWIGYGDVEDYLVRRRTETEKLFQGRKERLKGYGGGPGRGSRDLYDRLVGSGRMRDVVVKEYEGMDHAGVGGACLLDGINYFMDW
ncbi:Alpha/Beta hydrolase protein [Podospora fimiseda]|uniref:Alpha/Beta hydrolase protein n=1 Tax=Podospora fimiseda TaxID=252190 RepID=A0AAN6YPK7_9PEZI|nr:Alpha/Beta hydrolase protein [Podospora fimiseda]